MKKKKERRVYLPRVLGSGQVMMPAGMALWTFSKNSVEWEEGEFYETSVHLLDCCC
jgi:hypothetical protein